MASVQVIPSLTYYIESPYHPGGFLRFPNITTTPVNATLGENVTSPSQQWIFQPTDETNTTFTILNLAFNTSYITASPGTSLLISNAESQSWYLRTVDAVYCRICYNAECSQVWAPWAEVGGPFTANEVTLAPSANATGHELWRISPVNPVNVTTPSTVTVTASASITSSGAPYLPSGSTPPRNVTTPLTKPSPELLALNDCAPCGNATCAFNESPGNQTQASYSVLIGQPVANCAIGNSENTKTTLGGTYELENSFNVEATFGTSLGMIGPSAISTTTISNTTSRKITESQTTEVNIPPGKIGGLVANISYKASPGKVKIDHRMVDLVLLEPENVIGYSVVYVDCGNLFSALEIPKKGCMSSGASGWKSISIPSLVLLVIALTPNGLLSV